MLQRPYEKWGRRSVLLYGPPGSDSLPWEDPADQETGNATVFYHVVLGGILFRKAVQNLLCSFKDHREEEPYGVSTFTDLAIVVVDSSGKILMDGGEPNRQSIGISSFGYGYQLVRHSRYAELTDWSTKEMELKNVLLERLISTRSDKPEALTRDRITKAANWLFDQFKIPSGERVMPTFVVRIEGKGGSDWPRPDVLNSFFLDDLERAKLDQ